MAIRVKDNGTVVIEKILKVTKELNPSDLSSFEDNFNCMMYKHGKEFEVAIKKRLEACEEAVETAKDILNITETHILYTSKEGNIRAYSFRAANAMEELLVEFSKGKSIRIGYMDGLKCMQLLKAISRFPSNKWSNEEFEMIFNLLDKRILDFQH